MPKSNFRRETTSAGSEIETSGSPSSRHSTPKENDVKKHARRSSARKLAKFILLRILVVVVVVVVLLLLLLVVVLLVVECAKEKRFTFAFDSQSIKLMGYRKGVTFFVSH
tara:strand:- start:126 stop:455 length:330 start_codon:yes stop_codon:yes gene_type:complete